MLMDLIVQPQAWISLFTLTLLEVVLGVDNLIFISIASSRLPQKQQKLARRFGLLLALGTRLLLLTFVFWLVGFTTPLFTFYENEFSGRDLLLIAGGLFLLVEAVRAIHSEVEHKIESHQSQRKYSKLWVVIVQIAILDIVFSFDSIFTAVGMTDHYPIMVAAITIAIITMIFASEVLSRFIEKHPTVKMLALCFLVLVGMALIADGFAFHIPRPYIYFAIIFAVMVETLNIIVKKRNSISDSSKE